LTNYDAKIKARGADFSLVVRPFAKYDFEHFFVRGGGHYSEVTLGSSSYGGVTLGATMSGLGWLAGAGLELPLTEALSIQAAYTHYGSAGGENILKFDAITAGLRFNF
jgi:opacity protein-like surface antigen